MISTIDEMTDFLKQHTDIEILEDLKKCPYKEIGINFHFNYGLLIRNSVLKPEICGDVLLIFYEKGISSFDDISLILIKALWCNLNEYPFNLDHSISNITNWYVKNSL